MIPLQVTAFSIAQRFVGTTEAVGVASNPLILAMLKLDQGWPQDDEVPWCSAFLNWVAWLLRLPRSKSLAARSWLTVGQPIPIESAEAGFDVVVFSRGGNPPGPEVLNAPGHVALFASVEGGLVYVLGGNQGDTVKVSAYPLTRVLGVRRLC